MYFRHLFLTLFFFVFIALQAQNDLTYEKGQLFVQVRTEFLSAFSADVFQEKKDYAEFRITSFSKAFKINAEPLNRIYLVVFDNFERTDLLINKMMETGQFTYVERVAAHQSSYTPNDLISAQWNLKKILAEKAWDIKKGSSDIVIAIVDDAMDTVHPDLEPVVWRNKSEIRGNGIDDDANGYTDDYIGWDCADYDNDPTPGGTVLYHGTHCSGIAGAATNNSKGIASIGFGCRLMIAKIGRPVNGNIRLFNAYQGVEYAIINKANIISMSWGGGGYNTTYQLLFDYAYDMGIICVAATGNDTDSSQHYPAAYNHVIAVGATTSSDKVSWFSNYGSWVDVMAPGSGIYSTLPNNKYGYLDGTSMACPLVSGLCGLMLSKNPYATPDEIEACLKSGCDNINSLNSGYVGYMGAGRINAEKSMKCLKSIDAYFTSNTRKTCPGDTIQFFDKTLPKPVALKWRFNGGTPSNSFASNPKIRYTTAGTYDVELIVFDSTTSDTLRWKNYVTIAKPTAVLSVNRAITAGSSTSIRIDFTGQAPFQVTLTDGTTPQTISNIGYTPYYHVISPLVTTTYSITSFNDKKCSGTFSGTSKVTVSKSYDCNSGLRYQASFGGTLDDLAYGITEDKDKNVYITGQTLNYGNGDGFFAKFNSSGNMVWYKTYGGSANDLFQKHILTPDNGFLLIGNTYSYGVGGGDVWIIKVDSSGAVQWSKTVGGSGLDFGWNACVTNDNGYFVYGHTNSYGAGDYDNYLIKLDKNGNLKWTKTYGNAYYSTISGLITYTDGSAIFCSNYRTSTDGEFLMSKIDSSGNLAWSKRFGDAFDDGTYALTKGSDNNAYVVGLIRTSSTNQEMLIACFTPNGVNKWMKLITGSGNESIFDIEKDGDNFVVSGYSNSYGAGGNDASLIKFDTSGNILFAKIIGGSGDEVGADCIKSLDGGYYMLGHTKSFTNGSNDVFINKFSCKPALGCNEKDYTPATSNISLTINNESQSTSSGGTLNSQTITPTNRSAVVSYQCKVTPSAGAVGYNCLKVDNYSKISSTTTGFTGNLDDGDYFGQTVRNFGDFDGDGVEDLIAGAQNDDDGGTNWGAVYIILLKSDGSVKSKQKISSSSGSFTGNLSNGIYFGSGVSRLKDLDGDGVNDLVVGHIYESTVNTRSGAVWIMFLNANGTVKSHQKIANGVGGFPSILDGDDNFGCDVNEIGDMNGDGTTDIMVGAPYDDDGGTDRGAVYIIYLNTNGTVKSYKKISSTTGGFGGSLATNDMFGHGVGGSADINYDGKKDIIVGARGTDDGGTDLGAVWILFLDATQSVTSHQKIGATSGSFTGSLSNGDYFGAGMEFIGDINNDGYIDLAVSAPYDNAGGTDRGAGWLLHLDNVGKVKSHIKVSSSDQSLLKNKIDDNDLLGWRISVLNDIDGNGQKEIVMGAMLDDDGGTNRGAVYIFNLGDTCQYTCLKTTLQTKISATQGGFSGSLANSDGFGSGVNGVGDIDGDGIQDIAVCASNDDDGGSNVGAVWILFMKKDGTVRTQTKISATSGGFTGTITNGNYFGNRIVPLGDLNADGVPDIAVSHHFDNSYTTRAGAIWVLFLNSNGTVKSHQKITTGVGGFSATLKADDRFGLGLENIGDFNGDGIIDLLTGAQEDKDGGTAKGAVYILYMNTNGTVKSYSKISATQGNFTGTLNSIDRFGFSVTSPGDLNKDGVMDFIVGSRDDADGGTYRGAIWTLFMNANGTVKSQQKNSSTIGNLTGIKDNDQFGQDIRTIDDLDNDGINEIVVSAAFDDDGGTDRGSAWIVFLNNGGKIKKQIKISSSSAFMSGKLDNSDYFGYGLGVINDLNGDGYKEVVAGAFYDDDGGADRGAVYILNTKDTCASSPVKPACRLRADFSYKLACLGDTFQFMDVSKDSALAGIIKWKWTFGDGGSFEGKPNASHYYQSAGNYLVKLIVYTSSNITCADSITRQIKVNNQLKLSGLLDDTICISDSAYLGKENVICGAKPYTFLWQPSTGLSSDKVLDPKASPLSDTRYVLTVTDKNNFKVYDTVFIKVDSGCCTSYALFKTNGDFKCIKDTFILTNESVVNIGATYNWKISAGGSYSSYSGKTPPPLIFNKSGTYNVKLIINDLCGTDTMSKDLHVYPKPLLDAGRDTSLCMGDTLIIGPVALGMNTYLWTPSSGLSSATIAQPTAYFNGTIRYILKMTTESGCSAFDTLNINKIIEPKLNLGSDTSLCKDSSFTLRSNIVAKSYLWNDKSTLPVLKVNVTGTYWLEAKDKCLQRDTINIGLITEPKLSIGPDTIFCKDSSITLKSNIVSNTYLWSNGSNNAFIKVTNTGNYWLQVKNKCVQRDTALITMLPSLAFSLGRDTVLCSVSSFTLIPDINTNNLSRQWDNGATTATRTITKNGTYWLKLDNGLCANSDTVDITFSKLPYADLGPDTVICSIGSITIDATDSNAISYLWNDGDTRPIRALSSPGRYSVTLSNKCGSYKAFINIGNKKPPIPYLGEDRAICDGDTLLLDATNPHTDYYLWNDLSVKPYKQVYAAGTYRVTLGNICGDFDTSVTIAIDKCDCDLFIPNTFTPINSMGTNDLFKPVVPPGCEPEFYQLNIYNRWGEIIFTTYDYNQGWNGDYKGEKVANGNYSWIMTLKHPYMNKGVKFNKSGQLLILE